MAREIIALAFCGVLEVGFYRLTRSFIYEGLYAGHIVRPREETYTRDVDAVLKAASHNAAS